MSYTQPSSQTGSHAKSKSTEFFGEETAGIIHDLGNLIQIASSAVNLVARNPSIHTPDLAAIISGARTSLERAGALVRMTIGTARQKASTFEQVSVATCLAEVESLVQIT